MRMPTGMPSTRASTTDVMMMAIVSMASAHRPNMPIMYISAMRARALAHRRKSSQATAPTAPMTSHHGTARSKASTWSSTRKSAPVTASNAAPYSDNSQSTARSMAGPT